MRDYPKVDFRGYTIQPRVKSYEYSSDLHNRWYRYTLKVWEGEKSCVVRGNSLHTDQDSAAEAAIEFGKNILSEHLSKAGDSLIYKLMCTIGYCPASRYDKV